VQAWRAPHPRFESLKMQNVFPKFSETPGAVRSIAPQSIGEHNAEVLGGLLEMDQAELDRLKAAGVI
jgi:formyl-CoA transferase